MESLGAYLFAGAFRFIFSLPLYETKSAEVQRESQPKEIGTLRLVWKGKTHRLCGNNWSLGYCALIRLVLVVNDPTTSPSSRSIGRQNQPPRCQNTSKLTYPSPSGIL